MSERTTDDVNALQRLYPQVYLACHRKHVRTASTHWQLSSHDAALLAHLDTVDGTEPLALARHLGVVASTLSASIKRLAALGYLERGLRETDRRRHVLRLTALGTQASSATSVLDEERVRLLLGRLTNDERRSAVDGLRLLARAAREIDRRE